MELIFFLSLFLIFYIILIKMLSKPIRKNSRLKLPPGPKPLPIIGNIHQLFGSQLHLMLRDLAGRYGPLMHLKLGEISTIIVTSPEMAKEIYKTNDMLFASRPNHHVAFNIISYGFTDLVLAPYGNHWRQLRKICTVELLSRNRVQAFKSIREEEVFNLIKSIHSQKGSIINISKSLFSLSYGITGCIAFGKKDRNTEKYIQLTEEISKLTSGFSLADMYPSVKLLQVLSITRYKKEIVHKQVDEIVENILKDHKEKLLKEANQASTEETKETIVDVLLKIQKRGDFDPELTDTIIKAVIFDIFTAGSETWSTTMEWAISEIIRNPVVMERAQDEVRNVFDEKGNVDESSLHELKYLGAIIKETLRIHPSVPLLLPRECSEQCEINGYQIPAKSRVLVNAWAIGRDPMYWVDAEKFNPDRFLDSEVDYKGNNYEYIPFGSGRRICPGISYAQANIELLLAQLLFHFDWKLPGELKHDQLDMTENFGLSMRRKNDLHLILDPYHCSGLNKNY
ncbi:tabersonine 16-hydroxylase 2-like [Coffea arabica]|uniref:Tabersonine 16-hydroxylase 2-like n=1 Tax=Coffea arabica TaxID=13443 RepID=A0A6P6X4H8_COFAR|nr:tabersonine 16-hydroxylase 2-like [Coffea arabica]XP_027120747.1 tabersonine 16-hydroxylase 2-like [Coffea arabica]